MTTGNTDFDNTELGRAFQESASIREEMREILGEQRAILADEPSEPIAPVIDFARSLTSRFRAMPV